MNRREFLKVATGVALGIGVDEIKQPFLQNLNKTLTEKKQVEINCKNISDPNCGDKQRISSSEVLYASTIGPFLEEVGYRAVPSLLTSYIEEKPVLSEILQGTKEFKTSRRELIIGAITTAFFAINHLSYENSHAINGILYWGLQRRFGFLSNFITHAYYNIKTLQYIKSET